MLGFTFAGRHCSEFNICMKSKNRTMLPEPKLSYQEALNMDGSYDFSEVNPKNRICYKNREIVVDCYIVSTDLATLRNRLRSVASWLGRGENQLIFDDEPNVYYLAKVLNRIDFNQAFKRGYFTIVFDCRPFAYYNTLSNIVRNDITFPCAFNLNNPGFETFPEIIIEGTFSNIELDKGTKRLIYSGSGEGTLTLNSEKMTATLGNNNVLHLISGDFFTITKGLNIIGIYGDTLNVSVTIRYRICYL